MLCGAIGRSFRAVICWRIFRRVGGGIRSILPHRGIDGYETSNRIEKNDSQAI